MNYYHGGKPGLLPGDVLLPSSPHVTDGCPICQARAQGRGVTVGEYRRWLIAQGPQAEPVLRELRDAPDDAIIDPPTGERAVYLTTDRGYARFYAARSAGDLYLVRPVGDIEPSKEDPFDSYLAQSALVVGVLERGVRLRRNDRRELGRRWAKADRMKVRQ